MPVSIRPADHVGEPQPLNINDERVMGSIHEHTVDWLVQNYIAPPADPNSRFDVRGVPVAWSSCVSLFSVRHLFLYTFCLASNDPMLREWKDAREQASEMCDRDGDELKKFWLQNRPQWAIRSLTSSVRKCYQSWNWEIKSRFMGLASDYGVTGRRLFVAYSGKAMLGSNVDLSGWRRTLEEDVKGWDEWVMEENKVVRSFFGLMTR